MEDQEIELGNIPQSYEVPTTPHTRIHKDHPIEHVISDVQSSVQTRKMKTSYSEKGFLSAIYEGKSHQDLHTSKREELFSSNSKRSWILIDLPKGYRAIVQKWVYRNKKDERGIVIRNKARLVAQGHTQEEGIDYDEVFAHVARIEAIRIFLAYASYMGFMVYQMDVKSIFLYGQIEEELYGLHQAPRAWYDTLATYLLSNGFQREQIDQTLFIKRHKGHILLVQIYMDDIIFGYTKKELCDEFEKLMKDNQDKFVHMILRKFNYSDVNSASTSTDLEKPLVPDIMFAVCACARFQVSPKTSHLLAVKRIFRYLKVKPSLVATSTNEAEYVAAASCCGQHNMVEFLEKSTGSEEFHQIIDFLNQSYICYALTKKPEVCVSFIKQFWRSVAASTDDNGEVKINATINGYSLSITEGSLRQHLKLDDQDGISSIPNSEIFEQLALIGYHTDSDKLTFQKGAFSPQWRFLIHCILHCISPKKTAWEQFSSNIATAVICLATNWKNQLQPHSRTYPVPSLSYKVFNNMKRPTKGYSGQEVALFPTMLAVSAPSSSPSRITSSPSPFHSPEPSPSPSPATLPTPEHITAAPTQPSPTQPSPTQPSPTQPSPTQPSPGAEHHLPTPHDSPLYAVHLHGSDEGSLKLNELMHLVTKLSDRIGLLEDDLKKTKKTYSSAYTKLILKVKKLESQIKTRKARRKARVALSDDEVIVDDSYDAEKGSDEVSTAGAKKEKRSRQDKGKAIMIEFEPKKKSKKELEQERLSFAEAIRLEEQMNEEQRAQIARDEEIAR
ncbi:putative ribonuclease H-like domain-containing protein [Tanacetum coccineum]